jgi:UDP-glucose 4-epimerase
MNMAEQILVTGGAGFIGSHTCVELIQAGYGVSVLDSFVNSRPGVIERIKRITGRAVELHQGDLRDPEFLDAVFEAQHYAAVIHFAGLKAVGESVSQPLRYYDFNVNGTLRLLESMAAHGVERMVFSSSATVYGEPLRLPLTEDHPLAPTNPYGHTKRMIEQVLADLAASREGFQAVMLRYFNPVGGHESGTLGEDPAGIPNNLMPYVSQVAVGRLKELSVWGNDYSTPDGTGVRDYVHVVDLARAHVAAIKALPQLGSATHINLGTGRGNSVLEVVAAFERASGKAVPYRVMPRRSGDVASSYCDPALAERLLGWRAERDMNQMCRDAWRWQQWQAAHGTEL